MNPSKFPYDKQLCSIRIGSWQHDISRMDLKVYNKSNNEYYENDNFTPNPVWDVIKITNSSDNTYSRMPFGFPMNYTENETMNEDMVFSIEIKRIQLYYMINNIYPSLVLNIISLLAFFLPFASQVGLCRQIYL
jgi:nicotinic acetylcholine receptor